MQNHEHEWEPAPDVGVGRYRCRTCPTQGYRQLTTGQIRAAKHRYSGPPWPSQQDLRGCPGGKSGDVDLLPDERRW